MPRTRVELRSTTLAVRARGSIDGLALAAIPIVQTGIAAGLAWFLAHDVIGHPGPFFAPIASLIVLGLVPGQRTRRAIEVGLGVAFGIAIGDLLIAAIGTGAVQVALVVMLAMAAAVLVGGGPILIVQSAASAILIATLARPADGLVPTRLFDALIGAGVGLVVLALVPRNPLRLVERELSAVVGELAASLDEMADALAARDVEAARAALVRARAIDEPLGQLRDGVELARETTRLAPMWWRVRERIGLYADASVHVDRAVRNARVLARGAIRATELKPEIPAAAVEAVRALAAGVREVEAALLADDTGERAIGAVLEAARAAAAALDEDRGLSVSVLVGQVRSTCVDLLRALGVPRDDAARHVRRASR